MKILHVINRLGASGAEVMMLNLAKKLKEKGVEQKIVTLMPEGKLIEQVHAESIPLEHLGMHQGKLSLMALWHLRRSIKAFMPDVILGWMYHSSVAASLAAPSDIPVVWGIHHTITGLKNEKLLTRFLIRHGPKLRKRTARYIYVSEISARQHLEMGYSYNDYQVIPNGFDLSRFCFDPVERLKNRSSLGLNDEHIVFGSAARFHPMKNHLGLIEAFSRITTCSPHAILLLAGRNVDDKNDQLVSQIKKFGVESNVRLLGERSDIHGLMNAFDVYVSASKWGESFPLVLGEAMATGVPCITTDLGDCAKIVGDTGIVIKTGSMEALVDGLNGMTILGRDALHKRGLLARKRIEQYYSLDAVAQEYMALCRRVVEMYE